MNSGQLARLCGISTDTLRHYERVGVLAKAPRTRSGYRQYPPEAQVRVMAIRRALALGFSLAELARIFRVRERGGAPCREVRRLAQEKLVELEQRLVDLTSLRDDLRTLLADWDRRLETTPEACRRGYWRGWEGNSYQLSAISYRLWASNLAPSRLPEGSCRPQVSNAKADS